MDWNQPNFVDKSRMRIRNPEAIESIDFLSNIEYLHHQSVFYTELAKEVMEELALTITHLNEFQNES